MVSSDSAPQDLSSTDAPTIRDVLTRVGPGLLQVAAAPPGALDRVVTGVAIFDPLVDLPALSGTVLLGVGIDPASDDAADLLGRASAEDYAAVVFHGGEDATPTTTVRTDHVNTMAVLTAPAGVPWMHLVNMLRAGTAGGAEELGGVPLGDLFGFANSLAARVGGAVTIEDPQSQILAYSSGNEGVDEPRKETILGRQVPPKYMRILQERGVFRKLLMSEDIVEMAAMEEVDLSRRVAISVRAAGEVLGSIWTAETGRPLVADYPSILREAARTAALHLMRHRLDMHAESNLRRTMLRDILNGVEADVAGTRLALATGADYVVIAFEAPSATSSRNRLLDVIELYSSITGRDAPALSIGPRAYLLLPTETVGRTDIRRIAADGCRRATSALQAPVSAAIGRPVKSIQRVVESRVEADRVMRVLLRPDVDRAVADLDDVRAYANLLEVLDLLRDRPHLQEGPMSRLVQAAPGQAAGLVETVAAYVDHLGDVRAAAAHMNVHPNTFRYRLRRAAQLAEIDLDDSTERLMLSLQLRLITETGDHQG